jgi:hypothetical protein
LKFTSGDRRFNTMNHEALLSLALTCFTVRKSFVKITNDFITGHLLSYLWEEKPNEWASFTPDDLMDRTCLESGQMLTAIERLADSEIVLVRRLTEQGNTVEFHFLVDREKVMEAIAKLTIDS